MRPLLRRAFRQGGLFAALVAIIPTAVSGQARPPQRRPIMKIQRNGASPSAQGPSANFTGRVRIDSLFQAEAPARTGGAVVTFEPGARTNWHTHPLGQTLIVTAGVGWTQCEGDPKVEIRAGDVIWCPCQRRHWHGATPTTAMTHVAIAEALDGKAVDWMEPVSDEQYLAGEPQKD